MYRMIHEKTLKSYGILLHLAKRRNEQNYGTSIGKKYTGTIFFFKYGLCMYCHEKKSSNKQLSETGKMKVEGPHTELPNKNHT